MAITESWLVSTIPDSFLSIDGFHPVARTDVSGDVRKHGVCLYIRSNLVFVSLESGVPNVHVVHLTSLDCYIVVVYRPPSNSREDNIALINFLGQFCVGKEILVLGDFNLPAINWLMENALSRDYDPLTMSFTNCFNTLGLHQWINFPTFFPSGNTLDLVLSSEADRISNVQDLCPLPGCGHIPIIFDYHYMMDANEGNDRRLDRRAWFRGRYNVINDHLSSYDWEFEFQHLTVDSMVTRLMAILNPLIDSYVPPYVHTPPNLVLNPPNDLKRERKQAWLSYKNDRSTYGRNSDEATSALDNYNIINRRFKNFFVHSQINYEISLIAKIRVNPKSFHQYIRSKKIGAPSVGPLKCPDGTMVHGCARMADMFVEGFASVFKDDTYESPSPHQVYEGSLNFVNVSLDEVLSKLSDLDSGSSMGPDGLHPVLLKSCSELAIPILKIFTASLRSGHLPQQWKLSEVVPIFKKGSRSDPLNYRPISLTSVCCKTLERLVADCLYNYLETNSLLSADQFGFRRGRMVEDQLLLTYDFVTEGVDRGSVVDVVLFDFSKAFDVVSHTILLDKLRCLGVGDPLLSWIGSFLQGRSMYVSISGVHSGSRSVTSGVPQGSVLGPLLFLIYVNHLPTHVVNNCKIFADDLKIYLKFSRLSTLSLAAGASSCQRDIDAVCSVAGSWGLDLNREKCVVMRFQRGRAECQNVGVLAGYSLLGQDLSFVPSHKDLGVTVDTSLRFHTHIRTIVNKASGLSANFLRSTLCRTRDFMLTLLTTHIRPLLEYSSCVWNTGFVGDLRLLESVQRRWTRQIEGMDQLSYGDRLQTLDLYSIQGRLLRADLVKYWKIFNGLSSISPGDIFNVSPPYITRGHRYKILHTHCSIEARRRFFSIRCVSLWNSLPDDVVSLTNLQAFKSALHDFLGPLLYQFTE